MNLEFCRIQNKDISIVTESDIIDDQIHHTRNNCLEPIFSLFESHTERFLVLLHPDYPNHTDPKGMFVSFKVLPIMAGFSVFAQLRGLVPGNN